jgi:hypothetical protein
MTYIIDRIVNNIAVCEDDNKGFIEIDVSRLPKEAKAGSSFTTDDNGRFILVDDTERKQRIVEKMKRLWK